MSCAISFPFPYSERGHYHFAKSGHYYFAATGGVPTSNDSAGTGSKAYFSRIYLYFGGGSVSLGGNYYGFCQQGGDFPGLKDFSAPPRRGSLRMVDSSGIYALV